MGKMQRTKGRAFEQKIAADLRALWPGADVHRSSQADRARQSDVVIEGEVPLLARNLWLELQDAAKPTPLGKLAQAEDDIEKRVLIDRESKRPVVIWHRLREQVVHVTLRLWVLNELAGWVVTEPAYRCNPTHDAVVTLDWLAFCAILQALPVAPAAASATTVTKEEAA